LDGILLITMMKNYNCQLNIIIHTINGFPGSTRAAVKKLSLIAKTLTEYNNNVTILNVSSINNNTSNKKKISPFISKYNGIKYIYCGGTIKRNSIFLKMISFAISKIYEFSILKKLGKQKKIDILILSYKPILSLVYYWILSKIYKFKIVLSVMELHSTNPTKNIITKINGKLHARYAYAFADGVIPISQYIIDSIKKHYPLKPIFKLPVICDYNMYNTPKNNTNDNYFLYCGDVGYYEVILFIIESYEKTIGDYKLIIIASGEKTKLNQLQQRINNSHKNNSITLLSNIPEDKLINLYINAKALLIPLRNKLRDIARFPHKIGEYLASGNPIITTYVGEIKYYFSDEINAIIAKNYDVEEYANKMQWVIENPEKAQKIGEEGKKLGLQYFDYKIYGLKLHNFFKSLIKTK